MVYLRELQNHYITSHTFASSLQVAIFIGSNKLLATCPKFLKSPVELTLLYFPLYSAIFNSISTAVIKSFLNIRCGLVELFATIT